MNGARRNKAVAFLAALCIFGALFCGLSLAAFADTQTYTVAEVTDEVCGTFAMAKGASVRNNGNDAVKNGLKYTLTLSEAHYEGLMQNVENGTYGSMEFGIFILPKEYNDEYPVREYAFGENAKYNWAVKNAEGEWEYTEEDGKARIFRLGGTAMRYDENFGAMTFSGIVTGVLEENMGREMVGVGYLAYSENGETKYAFTPAEQEKDNVRTMAYVAQKAIEDKAENADWLQETYVAPVIAAGTEYSYTVEYYFEGEDGVYTAVPEKTITKTAKADQSVTAETPVYGKYEFDETNENNVLSGKVYALNGALALKCYYAREELALTEIEEVQPIDVLGKPSLDLTERYEGDLEGYTVTAELTAPNGRKISVADAAAVDTASLPQGVYAAEVKADGKTVLTMEIDVYDLNFGMVWQELSEYSVNDTEILCGSAYLGKAVLTADGKNQLTYEYAAAEDVNLGSQIGMRLRALHSKEYYVAMSENYSAITFDIYVSDGLNVKVCSDDDADGVWQGAKSWATYSVPVDYLLEKWDSINGLGNYTGATAECQLFTTFYGAEGHSVSIGNFGCVPKTTGEIVEAEGVQLVETAENPVYDLLSLDTENKLDAGASYTALLTAPNGRKISVADATAVDTASLPQGMYAAEVKSAGAVCLTATLDIYKAADGMVWQELSEYSVNDARVWRYGYENMGAPSFASVDGTAVLQFSTAKENDNALGLRVRALHSKEYYETMSENYSAITFDVYLETGMNVETFIDADGDGIDDAGTGAWQKAWSWKTYTLPIEFLLKYWDNFTDLQKTVGAVESLESEDGNGSSGATYSMLMSGYYSAAAGTVSIGNFGCVPKTTETAAD